MYPIRREGEIVLEKVFRYMTLSLFERANSVSVGFVETRTPIQSHDTSFVGGIQLDVFVYSRRKSSNIVLEMQ